MGLRSTPKSHRYQLLTQIACRFAIFLRSTSRCHMRRVLRFIHKILPPDEDDRYDTTESHWQHLRSQSAPELLQLYTAMRFSKARRISRACYYWELRCLKILYRGVLHHDNDMDHMAFTPKYCLPLEDSLCHIDSPSDTIPDTSSAFSVAEVHRILAATQTTEEQLVILLFLTWGLRIGGLVRLCASPSQCELYTIEKGGQQRILGPLSPVCRVLLRKWYEHGRQQTSTHNTYVFPSKGGRGRHSGEQHHICTMSIWRLCRRVFRRAGLTDSHAHPHTFRHTVIQMVHMCGVPYAVISKWIGHSSSDLTSGVYGRMSMADTQALLQRACPFLQPVDDSSLDPRIEWRALALHLGNPYAMTLQKKKGVELLGAQ